MDPITPAADEVGTFPVLPLRDIVILPGMIVPLFIGRPKSVRACDRAMADGGTILLVTQVRAGDDELSLDRIYPAGALASILESLRLPDGTIKVLVEVRTRAAVIALREAGDCYEGHARRVDDVSDGQTSPVTPQALKGAFADLVAADHVLSPSLAKEAAAQTHPALLADLIASHARVGIPESAAFLATTSVAKRLEMCSAWIAWRRPRLAPHAGQM